MYGYKGFEKGLKNRYGKQFVVGESYQTKGDIEFGNEGKGYHFCQHLGDVFRFFNPEYVDVALVSTMDEYPDLVHYDDDYNGYYDMYSCRNIKIEKLLSREEIISTMLKETEHNIEKFIKTFKLNDEEAELFASKSIHLKNAIQYYHYGDKEVYSRGGLL